MPTSSGETFARSRRSDRPINYERALGGIAEAVLGRMLLAADFARNARRGKMTTVTSTNGGERRDLPQPRTALAAYGGTTVVGDLHQLFGGVKTQARVDDLTLATVVV